AWIAKTRSDFRRVLASLDDLATVRDNRLARRIQIVHHDVEHQARCVSASIPHPRSAHLPGRVVERSASVAALPGLPTEDFLVKRGRAIDVRRREFDVADLDRKSVV